MKMFDDSGMLNGNVQGFGFSAVRPESLGASEYTLVDVQVDVTGSTQDFASELHKALASAVGACRKSPRSDFILIRVCYFNTQITEIHGYKPLADIDPAGYPLPNPQGLTALYDASFAAVAAMRGYGKTLADQEYLCNGLSILITDGGDNQSRMGASDVKAEIKKAVQGEELESLRTILVAVNSKVCGPELQKFQTEVGIDQYVEIDDASPQKLAKLADFVSRSVSAQSQSLGTGGPSQALVF